MPQHSIQSRFPSPYVPFAPVLARAFSLTEKRMRAAHETHLGYPCNLSFEPAVPAHLSSNLINGLGDPYVGSQYGSQVCDLEREAASWLMRLWQCDGREQFWGSVSASGTEGNFWESILAARRCRTLF